MSLAHPIQHTPVSTDGALMVVGGIGFVLATTYLVGALRARQQLKGWPWGRTASFLIGTALLVLAFVPTLSPFQAGSFTAHTHQHLLIGMLSPLGLVLGAPVTLAVRLLPRRHGRSLTRVLRWAPMRIIANPFAALLLNIGGLVLLYFSPFSSLTTQHENLHHLVHLHFFIAGSLFTWVIAGPDPAPHRPSVPVRLFVLALAITGHAVISQLVYADLYTTIHASPSDLRAGGSLMYFGGDIAELLLALALVTTWRPHHRHVHKTTRRTSGSLTQEPTCD